MNHANYRFSLDVHDTSAQVSLSCKKSDTSRKMIITLSAGGAPYALEEGCYAVFTAKKPDGTVLFDDCIVTGDIVTYAFTEQTANVSGKLDCELRIYSTDEGLITSPRFILIVHDTVLDESEIESSSEFSALTKLMDEALLIINDIETRLANGEFDGTDGESAYQIAVNNGFEGTEEEWLESMKYVLTDEDAAAIVEAVLAGFPMAEEASL